VVKVAEGAKQVSPYGSAMQGIGGGKAQEPQNREILER